MKSYFIGLAVLMLGATGYLITQRPGSFERIITLPSSSPNFSALKKIIPNKRVSEKDYPYFSYVSGDVLVNTKAESYLAQIDIEIRQQDKIMVSHNSFAILTIAPNKYLRIGEATKISFEKKPKRRRGHYEFKLEKGRVFADIFADTIPIGLKIHFSKTVISIQDATFRLKAKSDGSFISSMDRGLSTFSISDTGQRFEVKAGFGLHNKGGVLEMGEFDWVDQFPWQERIDSITMEGHGKEATFKALPLSSRPRQVGRTESAVTWNTKRSPRVRRGRSKGLGKVGNMIQALGKTAGKGIKNVIAAPMKIKETTDSVKDFEKIQKQRAQALDSIE